MAKSLDEHISDAVERATQKAIAKMLKGIEKTVADIVRRSVSEAVNASEAGRMDSDRLVTVKEASEALGVNPGKVRSLAMAGDIVMVEPPGCRGKVLQSSINSYINHLKKRSG